MIRIKKRISQLNRFPRSKGSRLDFMRLDKNESLLSFNPDALAQIFQSLTPDEISAYPESGRLYQKLADFLGVKEENLVLTNGSDGGIKSAFEIFVDPRDKVMILDPTYAMYDIYIQMFGAEKVSISFNDKFCIDRGSLIKAISPKVKLIAIANPNSPTGTVLEQDFLLEIIERASSSGTAVLIDEAYFHFYDQTMLKFISRFDNLLILRTFSKAIGAASIRLGYAVAQPNIIKALFSVRPMYEAHTFSIKVAEFILDHPDCIDGYVKEEKKGRQHLVKGLEGLGFEVIKGQANFILVKAKGRRQDISDYLKSKGILIYLPSADSFLKDYFRVTTGPKQKMDIFLEAIKGYLDK